MAQYVTIGKGSWRGQEIKGRYKVLRPYKESSAGNFITVAFEDGVTGRVKCDFKKLKFDGEPDATQKDLIDPKVEEAASHEFEERVRASETEAEAEERISRNFGILTQMTKSVIAGNVRAAIVSGPAGIGKSHGVLEELAKAKFPKTLIGELEPYHVVKGMATPIALYKILWNYRHKGNVLVFDDCDSIFHDDVSLNLLKGALDTGKRRRIGWNAESRILKEDDIPADFDYEGSILFLTNLDFDHCKSKRLEPHLKALKSRCHYLDLTVSSDKDVMRRIRQLSRSGTLLEQYDLPDIMETEIINFIEANVKDLHELSLRTVIKVADLAKAYPLGWKEMAVNTVMRPEAKWRFWDEQRKQAAPAVSRAK